MGILAGKLNLNFDAEEYLALSALAGKYHIDLGNLFRVAAIFFLECDRRGCLTLSDPVKMAKAVEADKRL